ncbi:hypothetical protein HT031_000336 [Scenedesmus sp. PABB004]|nr:hypothetical protein HT031_000336 [Scenedesmus sp. PABB004]
MRSGRPAKQQQPQQPADRQQPPGARKAAARPPAAAPPREQRRAAPGDDDETRAFRRALRFPKAPPRPVAPGDPDYEGTPAAQRAAERRRLAAAYGPAAADRDVRLYLAKRAAAAARGGTGRGGVPLDDSFARLGTFLKLSLEFQRTVRECRGGAAAAQRQQRAARRRRRPARQRAARAPRPTRCPRRAAPRAVNERCLALAAALAALPAGAAWSLYVAVPGLLTLGTREVAARLVGLAHATGLPLPALAATLAAHRRLAFLAPSTAESRVGLLARVARLDRRRAVVLMLQHPALWGMSSRALAPRAEELALALDCCTVSALKLVGACPSLLSAPLPAVRAAAAALGAALAARPAALLPLLLARPGLLLPPGAPGGGEQQGGAGGPVQQVEQALGVLAGALQLPASAAQRLVLAAPELLDLAASGAAAVTGAAAELDASWLCASGSADRRHAYQAALLRQLAPAAQPAQQHRRRTQAQQAHPQQQEQGEAAGPPPRYAAADALAHASAACQWWAGSGAAAAQQQPPLQRLVAQAPQLLAVAAGGRGALELRLAALCDALAAALAADGEPAAPAELAAGARALAVLEPGLLAAPPVLAAAQLRALSRLLGAAPGEVWAALPACPAALWLGEGAVFARLRVLAGAAALPAARMRARLLERAGLLSLLLLPPAELRRRAAALAPGAAGADLGALLRPE